jgi:hypothetical protein
MVVLVDGPGGGLVAYEPTIADRIRARMLAARSDRRLARGEPPERDVYLALRAAHLVRSSTRRELVRSLRRLLEASRRPAQGTGPPLSPACRRRLAESRLELGQVIADLERPAPLSCEGLAALCVLLRDGAGPVYGPGSTRELCERLGQVHGQLVPEAIWRD